MTKTIRTPLFWDLHLHGVGGVDFMHASEDEMVRACELLYRRGTGYFAPTLLTAAPQLLRLACNRWGSFLEKCKKPGWLPDQAARPVGLHLEGPFLNPTMAGAHPKRHLCTPSVHTATELLKASQGHVAIVTLAPELPGAIGVIKRFKRAGTRVQLGHSKATASEAQKAVRAGASGLTHLFNAMQIHHRAPSVLAPLVKCELTSEIITDGKHLDARFVGWCLGAAGHHLYAVSDGCSAIGARKGAALTLGSLKLRREGPVAVVAENGTLAGGATFLTEHPSRLIKGGIGTSGTELLPLFYRIQRALFASQSAALARACNHFKPTTLEYVATE